MLQDIDPGLLQQGAEALMKVQITHCGEDQTLLGVTMAHVLAGQRHPDSLAIDLLLSRHVDLCQHGFAFLDSQTSLVTAMHVNFMSKINVYRVAIDQVPTVEHSIP